MHKMKRRGTLDACEFQRSLSVDSAASSPHRFACKKWRRRANNSMQSFFNSIDSVPGARFTKDDLPRSLPDTIQTRRTSFYVTVTHGVTILILGGTTLVATIGCILLLVDLMRT